MDLRKKCNETQCDPGDLALEVFTQTSRIPHVPVMISMNFKPRRCRRRMKFMRKSHLGTPRIVKHKRPQGILANDGPLAPARIKHQLLENTHDFSTLD